MVRNASHQECLESHLPLLFLDSVPLFVVYSQYTVFLGVDFSIYVLSRSAHYLLPFPSFNAASLQVELRSFVSYILTA